MDNIRLVLWKNARLRLYHPLLTALEICFPIFVFYQGIIFYNAFQPHPDKDTLYPIIQESELYSMFHTPYLIIAYAPNTSFTTLIMRRTMDMFGVHHIFPDELLAFDSETQIEILFSNDTYFQARTKGKGWLEFAVIFESTSMTTNVLRYQIRTSKEQLRNKDTRFIYPVEYYSVPEVNKEDEYLKSGFVGLEYAVNKAFITHKLKMFTFPTMNMQPFPYPTLGEERFIPEETVYIMALIGFIFLTLSVPHYIASERQSGMKELMKVAGLPELFLWFGWITYSLMIYPISITAVTLILSTQFTNVPFYENVSPLLVWTVLMLYCIAVLTFLFAVGTLFNKHWVAVTVSVITWFLTSSRWVISVAGDTSNYESRFLAFPLLCLLPNLVLFNAFKTLEYFEFKGVPTSISAIMVDIVDPHILHLRYILFLFLINIILNGCIIFYVSAVHPGRYGRKEHVFFMFRKIVPYFRRRIATRLFGEVSYLDNEFFEKIKKKQIAFSVRHLQKKFGVFHKTTALKDVNLDISVGDITVFIGHNGAGKTTFLNILTGMVSETFGTVMYNNEDITVDRKSISREIGHCPQQNVYFSYLTVFQHLLFFAMIKGQSEYRARGVAREILRRLRMEPDESKYVRELSAGAKRKLSLALALINYPKILILDEPTLGMDLISRRRTWALLKKIKPNRVILVTTQDMEEADLLGDRIAVMHDGHVFCYGSGLFLKTMFGTGYSMILSKGPRFVTEQVTSVVVDALPRATLQKNSDNYTLFKLPIEEKSSFSKLFKILETHREKLDITNIEVEYSTMEQLFINVHSLAARKDTARKMSTTPTYESDGT